MGAFSYSCITSIQDYIKNTTIILKIHMIKKLQDTMINRTLQFF